ATRVVRGLFVEACVACDCAVKATCTHLRRQRRHDRRESVRMGDRAETRARVRVRRSLLCLHVSRRTFLEQITPIMIDVAAMAVRVLRLLRRIYVLIVDGALRHASFTAVLRLAPRR